MGKAYLVVELSLLDEKTIDKEKLLALGECKVIDVLTRPDGKELVTH
jgi:hypothetical protein